MAQASACAWKRTSTLMLQASKHFLFIEILRMVKILVYEYCSSFRGTSGRLRHEQLFGLKKIKKNQTSGFIIQQEKICLNSNYDLG